MVIMSALFSCMKCFNSSSFRCMPFMLICNIVRFLSLLLLGERVVGVCESRFVLVCNVCVFVVRGVCRVVVCDRARRGGVVGVVGDVDVCDSTAVVRV